tara:strand:- start:1484 stop:2062 length:579 start_codon:yes stop_codon:yes gene_type:complete
MTTYRTISTSEVDPESPLLSTLAVAWTNNVLAITEGDPTAISEGKGIAIDLNGQTAILTDENDQSLVLSPDGSGSAEWVEPAAGSITNTIAYSNSVSTSGYVFITLPATGTFLAIGQYSYNDGSGDNDTMWGFCNVINNSEVGECRIFASNGSVQSALTTANDWVISGGQLRFGDGATGSGESGAITLIRIA